MRRAGLIASLGALAVLLAAATLGPGAAVAGAATVLAEQPVGPSGVGVPSNETPDLGESSEAIDDFIVPAGTHWRLSAIQVFGTAPTERGRTFNVKIWKESGGDLIPSFLASPGTPVFSERVAVAGGPDYLIPIEAAPRLEPDSYWILVQAVTAGGEDDWSWLTGQDTTGERPAALRTPKPTSRPAGAEPGQAFQLLGTATQVVRVSGWNYGDTVSEPPGLDCAILCEAEFPRGTTLTLNAHSLTPAMELAGWRSGLGSNSPPPCTEAGPCIFTLDRDLTIEAVFRYVVKVSVLRLVRNHHSGRGRLVVWLPSEGVLSMYSPGLQAFRPGSLPAGLARIPLVPRGDVATRLRRKRSAGVSAAISFRPEESRERGTVTRHLTLVRALPPGRRAAFTNLP